MCSSFAKRWDAVRPASRAEGKPQPRRRCWTARVCGVRWAMRGSRKGRAEARLRRQQRTFEREQVLEPSVVADGVERRVEVPAGARARGKANVDRRVVRPRSARGEPTRPGGAASPLSGALWLVLHVQRPAVLPPVLLHDVRHIRVLPVELGPEEKRPGALLPLGQAVLLGLVRNDVRKSIRCLLPAGQKRKRGERAGRSK